MQIHRARTRHSWGKGYLHVDIYLFIVFIPRPIPEGTVDLHPGRLCPGPSSPRKCTPNLLSSPVRLPPTETMGEMKRKVLDPDSRVSQSPKIPSKPPEGFG